MKCKKFILPNIPTGTDFLLSDEKVIVISFFGKSPYNAKGCKTGLLDNFPGRNIFQTSILDDPTVDETLLCDIEGYYDASQRIIFLHLRGIFDVHSLVKAYDQFSDKLQKDGYLTVWSDLKCRYARALLLLFSVSHILVLSQPSHTLDLSYLHLFRALDVIRQQMAPEVSLLLSSVPQLPKDWVNNARPCSPRVLFLFETCPAIYRADTHTIAALGSHRTEPLRLPDAPEKPSIKRLEHALEDQIYRILRKSRIITNVSTNSLFAIPANQEFVFVCTKRDPSRDGLSFMADSLVDLCNNANSSSRQEDPFVINQPDPNEHSFRNLIQQHVDQAFSKGFDDNVGRHVAASYFEMVPASVWHSAACKAFDLLVLDSATSPLAPLLRDLLHTDVNFSEARCGKVLPLATATYQENLPTHYTRDYHETRLSVAVSVFSLHARGPLYRHCCERLERECERHWKAGRQMCEVLSLTGNPCTAPLHRGGGEGAGGGELQPADPSSHSAEGLPVAEHCSGVRYVSACNCGRKQGSREDPFSVRAANFDFYHQMAEECSCGQLEAIAFPVFQPSTQDFKAAQLFRGDARERAGLGPSEPRDPPLGTPVGHTQSFSLGQSPPAMTVEKQLTSPRGSQEQSQSGFVSGQSAGSDMVQEEAASHLSLNPQAREYSLPEGHEIIIQVSDPEIETSKDKSLIRQPSTTEYLPGMLHEEGPTGLLPQFPSWSLVCLGPSSLYSHNLGLQDPQHAGLLGGSAYLLPWDVTVRLRQNREQCWLSVGDQSFTARTSSYVSSSQHAAAARGRKAKPATKDSSEFVVKIFVGVEYECPRGHRFMCSAPDKVLKTTGSGLVKDNGNRVTANDMPLYCACPCRSAKPLVAQLMRVHVVTPKAPVYVTLNPRVQPAPQPCPVFVTGSDQPLRLSQSAYWVLRLPYVYVGDHGPYIAPKDPVPQGYGRLLAGMYSITEQPPEEQ